VAKVSREAELWAEKIREGPWGSPCDEAAWKTLKEHLEKTSRIKYFGPFSLDDFPEIVTNMQAQTLGNALEQAEHWPDEYARQAGNPRRQDVEDAVMKLVPKLIVEASPRFHLERLTNFSKEFPQDLVSPVRKLWRDALIQQELIRAEKNIWNEAYGQAFEENGVEYTPRSEQEENVIPPLAALNKQLKANRETYLRNLQQIFREHGLLDDR